MCTTLKTICAAVDAAAKLPAASLEALEGNLVKAAAEHGDELTPSLQHLLKAHAARVWGLRTANRNDMRPHG